MSPLSRRSSFDHRFRRPLLRAWLSFVLAGSLVASAAAFAGNPGQEDPYYPRDAIRSGWSRGLPIQPVKRNIQYLEGEARARFEPKDNELVFANFDHDGRIWIAKLDPSGIDHGIVLREPWTETGITAPISSHTNLRLVFKPGHPVKLYPQTGEASAATVKPVEINDIVLSGEGFLPGGGVVMNNPVGMTDGRYPFAYRAKSTVEALWETRIQLAEKQRPLIQLPVCVSAETCTRLMVDYLDDSNRARVSLPPYHILLRNCTSELYRMIDAVAAVTPMQKFRAKLAKFGDWTPGWAKQAMECRGILDEKAAASIPNLEVELADELKAMRAKWEGVKTPLSGGQRAVAERPIPERALVLWNSSVPGSEALAQKASDRIAQASPATEIILKDTQEIRERHGLHRVLPTTDFASRTEFFVKEGYFKYVVPVTPNDRIEVGKLELAGKFPEARVVDGVALLQASAKDAWQKAISHVAPAASRPKFVIFWGSFGNGHKAAAEAIRDAILKRNPNALVVLKDAVDFQPVKSGNSGKSAFELLTRHLPGVYDKIYNWYLDKGMKTAKVGDMPGVRDYSFTEIASYLEREKPAAIISTFQRPTEALLAMREDGLLSREIPIVWQYTDYNSHPYLAKVADQVERTFVPHPAMAEKWVTDYGLDPSKIAATVMPVRDTFYQPFPAAEAEAFLRKQGLDPRRPTITLMSGLNAIGDFPRMVSSLAREIDRPFQIVAICAKSESCRESLEKLKGKLPSHTLLKVEGLVPQADVANYVRASRLFIGKAGGASSTETFVAGIPALFLDNNGGQERGNIQFFEELGLARGTRKEGQVGKLARAMLDDEAGLKRMAAALARFRGFANSDAIGDFAAEAAAGVYARHPEGLNPRLELPPPLPKPSCVQRFKGLFGFRKATT